MNLIATEIVIILLLLLLNGVFAMTELAMMSSRRARLKALADGGDKGAASALTLLEHPTNFLSSVQIGITLVGILAGAFGGATLASEIAGLIESYAPALTRQADTIALGIVVTGITFFSLILGELVPKRLALLDPERIASRAAAPMHFVAWLAAPLVRILAACTNLTLKLLRVPKRLRSSISEEEVAGMVREGMQEGIFQPEEGEMIESVLSMDRIKVRDIMTPRPRIAWLSTQQSHDEVWRKIVVGNHSQYPVFETSPDHVIGLVSVKSIYANLAAGIPVDLRALSTQAEVVSEQMNAIQLLRQFREQRRHIALVTNEFGGISGLVTLVDLLEAIVGDLPDAEHPEKLHFITRPDGSILVDALVGVEELEEHFPGMVSDEDSIRRFSTLAGFICIGLGHLPAEGESLESNGWRLEVLDMDGHRVDKVLVTPPPGS